MLLQIDGGAAAGGAIGMDSRGHLETASIASAAETVDTVSVLVFDSPSVASSMPGSFRAQQCYAINGRMDRTSGTGQDVSSGTAEAPPVPPPVSGNPSATVSCLEFLTITTDFWPIREARRT